MSNYRTLSPAAQREVDRQLDNLEKMLAAKRARLSPSVLPAPASGLPSMIREHAPAPSGAGVFSKEPR